MSNKSGFFIGVGDIHDDIGPLSRIPGIGQADGVIVSGDLTIKGGVAAAKRVIEAIAALNPRIYAQIGNMDYAEVQDYLDGEGMGIHARGRELSPGVGIMGAGWSTPTPFGTPSEVSEAVLASWLDKAYDEVKDYPHVVAVIHTPPFQTLTDRVGAGVHVGSACVRAFLERTQPDVCLTGHIHESRAEDAIGGTLVINPGALALGGYARLDVSGKTVSARLMTL